LRESVLSVTQALPQACVPCGQLKLHMPDVQLAVAPDGAEQTVPQAPQFDTSLLVLVHTLPHLRVLPEQLRLQAPPEQT
jgi:hypothetical protein